MSRFDGPLLDQINETVLDIEAIVNEIIAITTNPSQTNEDDYLATLTKLYIEKERDLKELQLRQKIREKNNEELNYLVSSIKLRDDMLVNVYEGVKNTYDGLMENILIADETLEKSKNPFKFDAERVVKLGFLYSRNYSVCGPKQPTKLRPYPTTKDFARSQLISIDNAQSHSQKSLHTFCSFDFSNHRRPEENLHLEEPPFVSYPMTIPGAIPIRTLPKKRHLKKLCKQYMMTVPEAIRSINIVIEGENVKERYAPNDTVVRLNINKLISTILFSKPEVNKILKQFEAAWPEKPYYLEPYENYENVRPEVLEKVKCENDYSDEGEDYLNAEEYETPSDELDESDDVEMEPVPQASCSEQTSYSLIRVEPAPSVSSHQTPLAKIVLKRSVQGQPAASFVSPIEEDSASSPDAPESIEDRTESDDPMLSPLMEQAPILSPAIEFNSEQLQRTSNDSTSQDTEMLDSPAQLERAIELESLAEASHEESESLKEVIPDEMTESSVFPQIGLEKLDSPMDSLSDVNEELNSPNASDDDDADAEMSSSESVGSISNQSDADENLSDESGTASEAESSESDEEDEQLDERVWDGISFVYGAPPDNYEEVDGSCEDSDESSTDEDDSDSNIDHDEIFDQMDNDSDVESVNNDEPIVYKDYDDVVDPLQKIHVNGETFDQSTFNIVDGIFNAGAIDKTCKVVYEEDSDSDEKDDSDEIYSDDEEEEEIEFEGGDRAEISESSDENESVNVSDESDDSSAAEEDDDDDSLDGTEFTDEYAQDLEKRYFKLQEMAEIMAEEEAENENDSEFESEFSEEEQEEKELERPTWVLPTDREKAWSDAFINAFNQNPKNIVIKPSVSMQQSQPENSDTMTFKNMKSAMLKYSTQFLSENNALLYRRKRLVVAIAKDESRQAQMKAVRRHRRYLRDKIKRLKLWERMNPNTRYRPRSFRLPYSGKAEFPPARDIESWSDAAFDMTSKIEPGPSPVKNAQQAPRSNNITYSLPSIEFRTTKVDYPPQRLIPTSQKYAKLYSLMKKNPSSPNTRLCPDDTLRPASVESCDLTPDTSDEMMAQWRKAYEAEEATLRRHPQSRQWLTSPQRRIGTIQRAKHTAFRPDMPRSYFMTHPRVRRARWNAKYGRYYTYHRYRQAAGVRQNFVYPHPRRAADPEISMKCDAVDLCWNLRKWNTVNMNTSFTNNL